VTDPASDADARPSIARPPTRWEAGGDRAFRVASLLVALSIVGLLAALLVVIGAKALPAVGRYGTGFLTDSVWDPNRARFGILPEIFGTLYTSLIALVVGGGLGVCVAIFLSQGFLPVPAERVLKNVIELLAAIPSVVYGLWGIFVVVPAVKGPADWLHEHLSFVPFFSTHLAGPGTLPASLVLAVMILPTVAAVGREAMAAVPRRLSEAAYGLGATRWEAILGVVVPTAAAGIFGGLVLGFGRALGETMALAMLAGNANVISWSLFSPADTLAALLANHFPEADGIEVGALLYAALVLLAITLAVNVVGAWLLRRSARRFEARA
jgi:phosphate transport system permease protein